MFVARRDFLHKSVLLALSSMVSACVTPSSGRLFGLDVDDTRNRRRDWLNYNPRESDQVEALFKEALQRKRIPVGLGIASRAQIESAHAAFEAVKAKYANRKGLEAEETYEVMRSAVPLLSLYARANSLDTRPESREKPSIQPNGALRIPPGTMVKMRLKGACLDNGRPAAGAGEKYRFSPSSDLINPALQVLYRAVARHEKAEPSRLLIPVSDISQKAMWTIRGVGTNNPLATHPSPEVLQHFDRVLPGGANLFQRTHAANRLVNSLIDDIGKQVSFNINGRQVNMADLANADRREATLNNMIQDLYRNPVKPSPPNDNRNYQPLSDTLASYNLGSAPLESDIVLINHGTRPTDFDACDWTLTASSGVAQRVGLYPSSSQPITFTPLELYLGSEYADLLTSEKTVDAVKRFLAGTTLRDLSQKELFQKYAARLLGNSRALKTLVDAMPVLGNALCYYEFVSGRNWVSGERLNVYEQIGAGFGALPVTGVMKGVFGNPKTIQLAMQTYNNIGLAKNLGITGEKVADAIYAAPTQVATAATNAWQSQQAQKMWGLLKEGASGYSAELQRVIHANN